MKLKHIMRFDEMLGGSSGYTPATLAIPTENKPLLAQANLIRDYIDNIRNSAGYDFTTHFKRIKDNELLAVVDSGRGDRAARPEGFFMGSEAGSISISKRINAALHQYLNDPKSGVDKENFLYEIKGDRMIVTHIHTPSYDVPQMDDLEQNKKHKLTSLDGLPTKVSGHFKANEKKKPVNEVLWLDEAEGCLADPHKYVVITREEAIKLDVNIDDLVELYAVIDLCGKKANKLTSLKGLPDKVSGYFKSDEKK